VTDDRRLKLERLRADGIDPFPHAFPGVVPTQAVRDAHGDLDAGAETGARYRVAGRIAARRGQGKMAFIDLVDRRCWPSRWPRRPRSTTGCTTSRPATAAASST
jgi:lysyl-tRNA synthetase class II